jgi:tetratricopeptide (TPR) repeat protein
MKYFILFLLMPLVTPAVFGQADSADFYFKKGLEEKTARRFMVAAIQFDKAIKFNPKFTEAYLQNGYTNLDMRKTDAALGYFTKVNELEPANKTAIKELASLYYDYRQFQKAIQFASKCDCENAERIIAMSNYQLEEYGDAVTGLLKVVAKNPSDAEATYTLGRSYVDMEQYKAAVPYYTKAVNMDPNRNVWAYELGLLHYNLDDFKNAVIYFSKAAEEGYPKSSDFLENLGYAYIYTGAFDQGEKLLMDVYAKKPGNTNLLRDIAETFYKQKMYDKSLAYCQKLMELDMKDAKALYQAGLCFIKKGEKDRGQGMCNKAIEMDPSLAGMRQKNMSMGGL